MGKSTLAEVLPATIVPTPTPARVGPVRAPTAHVGPRPTVFDLFATPVQRKASGAASADPAVPIATSGGTPLPPAVRAAMEAAFGADFSNVRVHEGADAATTAMGAVAFTQGEHIHFSSGAYQPDTVRGRELLGHELAHVIQQRSGRVAQPRDGAINTDASLEAEADALGAKVARGEAAAIGGSRTAGTAAPGPIQAKAEGATPEEQATKANQIKRCVGYTRLGSVQQRYADYLLSDDCKEVYSTLAEVTNDVKKVQYQIPMPEEYFACFKTVAEIDAWLDGFPKPTKPKTEGRRRKPTKKQEEEEKKLEADRQALLEKMMRLRAELAGALDPSEIATLGNVRQVTDSQPQGTRLRAGEEKPLWPYSEVPRWRASAESGDKDPARMATAANHEAAGIGELCVGCCTPTSLKLLQNDHQIAFTMMHARLVELGQLLSRVPIDDQLAALHQVGGPQWERLFIVNDGLVLPKEAALLDYSNDLGNLLLLCPTCNGFQAKSDIDVQTWFRQQALFGDVFLAQYASSEEFFGNPTGAKGWGTAAREWCHSRAAFIVKAIRVISQGKSATMKHGAALLAQEAKLNGLPEASDGERRHKKRARARLDRDKVGFGTSALLARGVQQEPGSEPAFAHDSDEEEEVEARLYSVHAMQDNRMHRHARRSRENHRDREALLERGSGSAEPRVASTVVEDVAQRRPWLANLAYSDVLGVPPKAGPLRGRDKPDGVELGYMADERRHFEKYVKELLMIARQCGRYRQAPPVDVDGAFMLMDHNRAALLQRVLTTYGEGVVQGPQPTQSHHDVAGMVLEDEAEGTSVAQPSQPRPTNRRRPGSGGGRSTRTS